MKRKLISIGAVVLVLALLLTLAPACGKGEGEVKTLKIGYISMLTGPGAPWGVVFLKGTEWAVDMINDRGGLEVGGDRYMVKVVSCDDKMQGSEAATCATKLIHDEGIRYIVGPHMPPCCAALIPICEESKTFSSCISFQEPSPEVRYAIAACVYPPSWIGVFLELFHQFHPEAKTMAYIKPETDTYEKGWGASTEMLAPQYGLEVVGSASFVSGTTDFYPQLTRLVALNPDVISTPSCAPNDNALITKQLRELGYEGLILHSTGGPIPDLIKIAGAEAMEGVITNEVDYTSPLVPEASREIYQDFVRRYPGEPLEFVTAMGFVNMMIYAQAIEEADSIDPEEVLKVIDDPNWTFDRFGVESRLGGMETFGINRQVPILFVYSEVENSKAVVKGTMLVETP